MSTIKTKKEKIVNHHEKNAKAVVSLMVLAIAFFVYVLFKQNQTAILDSSNLQMIVLLIVLLFGLLAGLLYLLSPSKK